MATTPVRRGVATIAGTKITFDVILSGTSNSMQSMQGTQEWDEELVKDFNGARMATLARDERLKLKFKMMLTGGSQAQAALAVSVTSALGAPFLPPLQSVVLSGGDLASWAGTFQMESGTGVDLGNTKVGDFDLSVIKWADATQNTLLNQTPS